MANADMYRIDARFDACVRRLYAAAGRMGIRNDEINVWLFFDFNAAGHGRLAHPQYGSVPAAKEDRGAGGVFISSFLER